MLLTWDEGLRNTCCPFSLMIPSVLSILSALFLLPMPPAGAMIISLEDLTSKMYTNTLLTINTGALLGTYLGLAIIAPGSPCALFFV